MNRPWNFFEKKRLRPVRLDAFFLADLIAARGEAESLVDQRVRAVLFDVRLRRAIDPWVTLFVTPFRLLWELTYGRYRRTRAAVHGGAAQASGGGTGAGSFTFTPGGTATTAPITASGTFADAGIRAGEVTAFRCWLLTDGKLYSTAMTEVCWEPGKPMEGDPKLPCQGVHAFKNKYEAMKYAFGWGEDDKDTYVSGTVDLWGDVYEHQRGYRASHAAVASIDESPCYDASELRKLYGLP